MLVCHLRKLIAVVFINFLFDIKKRNTYTHMYTYYYFIASQNYFYRRYLIEFNWNITESLANVYTYSISSTYFRLFEGFIKFVFFLSVLVMCDCK